MRDDLAIAVHLRLVLVIHPVKAPVEIVLILPPRHAGHHVHAIPLRLPLGNALANVRPDAIAHGHIRAKLELRVPMCVRLEARPLFALAWVGGTRCRCRLVGGMKCRGGTEEKAREKMFHRKGRHPRVRKEEEGRKKKEKKRRLVSRMSLLTYFVG